MKLFIVFNFLVIIIFLQAVIDNDVKVNKSLKDTSYNDIYEQVNKVTPVTDTTNTFVCGTSKVKDYDGNIYGTILIGNQCWMTENMKVLHYPDGTPIKKGIDTSDETRWRVDNSYYSCPPDSINEGEDCSASKFLGMLYQWSAAMNGSAIEKAQGICPDGWHIPSHDEWTELERMICNDKSKKNCSKEFPFDNSTTGWQGNNQGCDLAGNPYDIDDISWNQTISYDCDVEKNMKFKQIGFNIVPAGFRGMHGNYDNRGFYSILWTSTENHTNAWYRHLRYDNTSIYRNYGSKGYGFSVRCIKD